MVEKRFSLNLSCRVTRTHFRRSRLWLRHLTDLSLTDISLTDLSLIALSLIALSLAGCSIALVEPPVL